VLRQILLFQILIRGFVAVDLLPPQFLDQPILMHSVHPLHPPFRLGLRLRLHVTLEDDSFVSLMPFIPGMAVPSN